MSSPQRPQPLLDAAADVTTSEGLLMGVCTTLVSGGLISYQTDHLITGLYGLVPGALALLAALLGGRHVAVAGAALVTPVSDPQNNAGQRLVPATLAPPSPPLIVPPATTDPAIGPHSPKEATQP